MSEPQFIMHNESDSCAVAVVEGLEANTKCNCWIMDKDTSFDIEIKSDIPIGHKIAVKNIKNGDTIFKYDIDIGKCVQDIKEGEHLHVHNVKTKRW